ncbi:hypothetical protein YC2023_043038 [Brassica napus]
MDVPQAQMQYDDKSRVDKAKRRSVVEQTESKNKVELFLHLPQYERGNQLPNLSSNIFTLDTIHQAVYKDIAFRVYNKCPQLLEPVEE